MLFADLADKYIKILKEGFNGYSDLKYVSIYRDDWGNDSDEFHYYLRFKYNNEWYFMDRYECKIGRNGYKGKRLKEITYDRQFDLVFYIIDCGFKNQIEAEEDVFKLVDKHLARLLLTTP